MISDWVSGDQALVRRLVERPAAAYAASAASRCAIARASAEPSALLRTISSRLQDFFRAVAESVFMGNPHRSMRHRRPAMHIPLYHRLIHWLDDAVNVVVAVAASVLLLLIIFS